MKKIYLAFFILLITFGSAQADVVYVADDDNLAVRKSASSYAEVIKVLPTGTSVTVVEEPHRGFIKVKLADGTEGFIKTKYTKKEPPKYDAKDVASETIANLNKEIDGLKKELTMAKDAADPNRPIATDLENQLAQMKNEMNELKSADKGRLKEDRDRLQEQFVASQQELSKIKQEYDQVNLEKKILEDTTQQDWLLYGGALVIIGIFLGFILPKIRWGRSNSWDHY